MNTETYTAQIYIGGDLDTARRVCREFVYQVGECVTVEPVEYIYKGGSEAGVRIGFINYPRFPQEPAVIFERAWKLAALLMEALCQHSYSIVATDRTEFSAGAKREGSNSIASPAPEPLNEEPR